MLFETLSTECGSLKPQFPNSIVGPHPPLGRPLLDSVGHWPLSGKARSPPHAHWVQPRWALPHRGPPCPPQPSHSGSVHMSTFHLWPQKQTKAGQPPGLSTYRRETCILSLHSAGCWLERSWASDQQSLHPHPMPRGLDSSRSAWRAVGRPSLLPPSLAMAGPGRSLLAGSAPKSVLNEEK